MRKSILTSIAAVALLAAGAVLGSMFARDRTPAGDDLFVRYLNTEAAAQGAGLYINAVDLVIVPSEMSKFVEAIKDNGANAVKEPGCREFNITVLANRPNHVFLYEVYDNEAALAAHRNTEHFKKYMATTGNMVADRNVRAMSVIAMNSKGHT
jgi:(4S)-4-hydroxy-5-phosphonooxypentane-2,3-dione isomerase